MNLSMYQTMTYRGQSYIKFTPICQGQIVTKTLTYRGKSYTIQIND